METVSLAEPQESPALAQRQPLRNALALARGISQYAAALKAIADSDTGTKVTESINLTLGSIEQLAATVGAPASAVAQFKPVTNLLIWLLNEALERRKVNLAGQVH